MECHDCPLGDVGRGVALGLARNHSTTRSGARATAAFFRDFLDDKSSDAEAEGAEQTSVKGELKKYLES